MAARLRDAADEVELLDDTDHLEDTFARGMVTLLLSRGYTLTQLCTELRAVATAVDMFGVER